jgi:cellulose synthase/poly-beta-1,6-N-acetylglucosamine synthase-like glycosyltransferase
MLRKIEIFQVLDNSFLWYFTAINVVYLLVLVLGSIKILRRKREIYFEDYTNILRSNTLPEISFIIPAFNEAKNILDNIKNLENLSYPYKQIIIVNDGSSDHTLDLLQKELSLYSVPKYYADAIPTEEIKNIYLSKKSKDFVIIDKINGGGKFDALNAGINASKNPYYIAIDADTIIDDKTFLFLIRPLLTDANLIAVGASVKIRNGCQIGYNQISTAKFPESILPVLQTLEYMRSFLERQGWDYAGGNFVLAGAFGIFRKEEIVKIGGYANTVAEDMEIIIRLHRVMKKNKTPYRIMYLPDPVAWTKAPDTLKSLKAQRTRWHKGLLDSLFFHKKMFFNPRYGIFGIFVFPFWIWGEAIEPVIEFLGIIYVIVGFLTGLVHIHFVMLFIIVTWGFTVLFTAHCILIEEFFFRRYPSIRSLFYLITVNAFENIGYRQMNVLWRLRGWLDFFKTYSSVKNTNKQVSRLIRAAVKGKKS